MAGPRLPSPSRPLLQAPWPLLPKRYPRPAQSTLPEPPMVRTSLIQPEVPVSGLSRPPWQGRRQLSTRQAAACCWQFVSGPRSAHGSADGHGAPSTFKFDASVQGHAWRGLNP